MVAALAVVGLASAAHLVTSQVAAALAVVVLEGPQDCKHRPQQEHESALVVL